MHQITNTVLPTTACGQQLGLHDHLFGYHQDPWIAACNKLGIQIKLPAAQGANGQVNDLGYPHKLFSNENFVDALGEFIVGDDRCVYSCAAVTDI